MGTAHRAATMTSRSCEACSRHPAVAKVNLGGGPICPSEKTTKSKVWKIGGLQKSYLCFLKHPKKDKKKRLKAEGG